MADWTPTDEQVSAAADALVQYETSGMCHPGKKCQMCDCGLQNATRAELAEDLRRTLDRALYVLAVVGPAIQARALTEAADALEGRLGIAGTPRDLWEFREWLRARAEQIGDDR